jgi:hypothetical protein
LDVHAAKVVAALTCASAGESRRNADVSLRTDLI